MDELTSIKRKARVGLLLVLLIAVGYPCYRAQFTGTVVDAETGKPIEGALVVAAWTVTHGLPGMSYERLAEIVETRTDEEGEFHIFRAFHPFRSFKPEIAVHKEGYVGWREGHVFTSHKERRDFHYGWGVRIELERFKGPYSKQQYEEFLTGGLDPHFFIVPEWSKVLARLRADAMKEIEEERKRKQQK